MTASTGLRFATSSVKLTGPPGSMSSSTLAVLVTRIEEATSVTATTAPSWALRGVPSPPTPSAVMVSVTRSPGAPETVAVKVQR